MKVVDDFRKKGYSQIPTGLTSDFLQKTVESFREFDREHPNEIKDLSYYNLDTIGRRRLGYKDKSDDPDFDSKCYFHYNVDMLNKPVLKDNDQYQDFIQNMDIIYTELDHIIKSFLDDCEANNIMQKSDFIRTDGTHNSLLRILNYKPKLSCETLAKAHTDRGGFTFTIYETHNGLQFLSENRWININYKPGILNLFPSDYWSKTGTDSTLGTSHQVIKKGDNLERSAIVIFVSPLTHTP